LKPNQEKLNYTATIWLRNSAKIGFARRDLALCFFPRTVVEKADRVYESIWVDGARSHEDNPELIEKIWERMPKADIYNGIVKRISKQSFNWGLITKRVCRDYQILDFKTEPERQRMGSSQPVTKIRITTDTMDFSKHREIIQKVIDRLKTNPHLTWELDGKCERTLRDDKCPLE
jgi:hypothetical protein